MNRRSRQSIEVGLKRKCTGPAKSGTAGQIPTRCNTQLPHKGASQMTLIRKARHYRCLGRCVPVCQKPLGQEYTALNKISVRCDSYFVREGPQELETGYARQCRQLGEGHLR